MFWNHTAWYLLLLVGSLVTALIAFGRSQNRRFTFVFSLAVLGFTYLIEAFLLIVLNAYTYYPMITPNDPFFDAVLGNFFSQISITTSAVLFCTLDLKSIYVAAFAFSYYLVDMLFVRLGIYKHFWYTSELTLVGFVPIFLIIRRWYLSLKLRIAAKKKGRLFQITLFMAIFTGCANTLYTSQKWIGVQMLHSNLYADPSKDHTATALLFVPLLTLLFMWLRRWNPPLLVKTGIFAVLFLLQYALYRIGFFILPSKWFTFAMLIDNLGGYLWTVFLSRLWERRELSLEDDNREDRMHRIVRHIYPKSRNHAKI